jgi:hypothetical protein
MFQFCCKILAHAVHSQQWRKQKEKKRPYFWTYPFRRMPCSRLWRGVAHIRMGGSEKCIPSIFKVTRISELGKTLTVTRNLYTLRRNTNFLRACFSLYYDFVTSTIILFTLMMGTIIASETWDIKRATWSRITEDSIRHSHRCEKPKTLHNLFEFWALLR